jgi:hypothetical protein
MKKITEQINTLNEVNDLIRLMEQEIDEMRNLLGSYNIKHGKEISQLEIPIPTNVSFIKRYDGKKYYCEDINFKELGIKSNYMIITEMLEKLR